MNYHEKDLPFDEIRKESGDYFDSIEEAMKETGLNACHIWSVVEADDDQGGEWICYGPCHHYINLLGLVATKEKHDCETYYNYEWRTAEENEGLDRACE